MIPDHFDEFAMAKLAREMAMNIRNYKTIFEDFGIDEEQYYEIAKHEFFKRAKEQFAIEWNSALSANDRVKLIMAAYTEEMLPKIGAGALDDSKPLSDRLAVFNSFCKGAGIGEAKPNGNGAERFVININMGGDIEHYDKAIAIDVTPENPVKAAVAERDRPSLTPPNKPDVD
jgi:hypothetical protein